MEGGWGECFSLGHLLRTWPPDMGSETSVWLILYGSVVFKWFKSKFRNGIIWVKFSGFDVQHGVVMGNNAYTDLKI